MSDSLTAVDISRITGITQKTVGIWLREITNEKLLRAEQEAAEQELSVKQLLNHLKQAKSNFINEVDNAIDKFLQLNQDYYEQGKQSTNYKNPRPFKSTGVD